MQGVPSSRRSQAKVLVKMGGTRPLRVRSAVFEGFRSALVDPALIARLHSYRGAGVSSNYVGMWGHFALRTMDEVEGIVGEHLGGGLTADERCFCRRGIRATLGNRGSSFRGPTVFGGDNEVDVIDRLRGEIKLPGYALRSASAFLCERITVGRTGTQRGWYIRNVLRGYLA